MTVVLPGVLATIRRGRVTVLAPLPRFPPSMIISTATDWIVRSARTRRQWAAGIVALIVELAEKLGYLAKHGSALCFVACAVAMDSYPPLRRQRLRVNMNTSEKIVGAYLRLNGFLLLPHFTILDGEYHTHVDFVGLRPRGGVEVVRGEELPRDTAFEKSLALADQMDGKSPTDLWLGIIVEVKTSG